MNLVSARRADQQGLAKLEIEVSKLADHIDEVDEYLRGDTGSDSVATRMSVLEKDVYGHGVALKNFGRLETYVATLKIHRGLGEKAGADKADRFKEWLKFWGVIISLAIGLIVPLATLVFNNWDKIRPPPSDDYRPDERLRKQIEADKKSQRAAAVKKKLAALEKVQKERS